MERYLLVRRITHSTRWTAIQEQKKWSFKTAAPITCAACLGTDGTIYVAANNSPAGTTVYALNSLSGSEKWRYSTPFNAPSEGLSLLGNSTVVIPLGPVLNGFRGRLVGLDATTGLEQWEVLDVFVPTGLPLSLSGSRILVSGTDPNPNVPVGWANNVRLGYPTIHLD